MTIIDQKSLAFKGGTSDKVYNFQMEQVEGGYRVNFQNGKRGGTLTNKTKTENPVTLEEAQDIFKKLLNSKLKDGYSEGEAGTVFQSSNYEERFTGIIGQMLNSIDDPAVYIMDDNYFMEEKKDGNRNLTKVEDGKVISINKKGLEIPTIEMIAQELKSLQKDLIVDGELVGDKYYVFDILSFDGKSMREVGAKKRYEFLKTLNIKNVVPAYFTKEEKRAALESLMEKLSEGVVFKRVDSPYVSGRPNSLGHQLKFKFLATDTFEVVSHNKTKRSVNVVSYLEDGTAYDMGKITIPPNKEVPPIGSFVEIQYLYCYVGGKLFQTVYLHVRNDQDRTDCHMREIKYKSVSQDDEE